MVKPRAKCHPGCAATYCKKGKAPVYEIVITEEKGYHLRQTHRVGKKRRRQLAAYECLDPGCDYDFRVTVSDKITTEHGVQIVCPVCDSLYIEWLSYDSPPEDVYLDVEEEWDLIPMGTVKLRKKITPDQVKEIHPAGRFKP